jgi:SPP1 family phage portal protein
MLTIDEIKSFIANDAYSQCKKDARTCQQYYDGEHDIKRRRIFFINEKDQWEEDKVKSNIRMSHPFHRLLTDELVQYTLSNEGGFMKSDDPFLQSELDKRFNDSEDFMAEMYDTLTRTVSNGWGYLYAYKNEDDQIAFEFADGMKVIEIRAADASDNMRHVIYWYDETTVKNESTIRYVQVWDDTLVYYYKQVGESAMLLDEDESENPRPHTVYSKGGKPYANDKKGFGTIPFFRIDNNRNRRGDLWMYKDLIDDYDLMNVDLSNNLQDTNEVAYALIGFDGDNLDELMQNFRAKKAIGMPSDGKIEAQTVDIPVEARTKKMDIDEQNIFRFGMGLNTDGLKDTNATTNIAIKSAYSLLDLKANKLKIRLKQFLRKLLGIVLAEINQQNGTDYQQKDVYFSFDPEIPTNEQENAQIALLEAQKRQAEINTLLSLATQLGNDLMMELICEQLEIDYNEIKSRLPKEEDMDGLAMAQKALQGVEPSDGAEGEVIE